MHHFIRTLAILIFLLLAGCATGGGKAEKALVREPSDIESTHRTPEPAARPRTPPVIPPPEVKEPPDIKSTQRTPEPVALPRTPPAILPPEAAQRRPAPPPTIKQACKVKKDSVEWVHISGGCKNGYAHGAGRARSVDGRRSYAGMFVDGAFSGQGDYDWGNGVRYIGEFLNGRKTGFGILAYPNNRKYTGRFKDNAYQGEGTYIDADGSKYAGAFENGYFHGLGTYTWASGDVYTGRFEANRMNGKGSYARTDGDRYDGGFKNNQMDGDGTYTWSNGDAYTGRFENDKMNGKGTYTYANGAKYSGEFKDGRKHGRGVLTIGPSEIKQQWWNGLKITEDRPSGADLSQ
jgi:hypothetical protein